MDSGGKSRDKLPTTNSAAQRPPAPKQMSILNFFSRPGSAPSSSPAAAAPGTNCPPAPRIAAPPPGDRLVPLNKWNGAPPLTATNTTAAAHHSASDDNGSGNPATGTRPAASATEGRVPVVQPIAISATTVLVPVTSGYLATLRSLNQATLQVQYGERFYAGLLDRSAVVVSASATAGPGVGSGGSGLYSRLVLVRTDPKASDAEEVVRAAVKKGYDGDDDDDQFTGPGWTVAGAIICRLEESPFASDDDSNGNNDEEKVGPEYTIYIQSLALFAAYRSQGLMTRALNALLEWAEANPPIGPLPPPPPVTSNSTSIVNSGPSIAPPRSAKSAESASESGLEPTPGTPYPIRITHAYCHVWTANTDVVDWYLRVGFSKAQPKPVEHYYWRLEPDSAWVLVRKLTPTIKPHNGPATTMATTSSLSVPPVTTTSTAAPAAEMTSKLPTRPLLSPSLSAAPPGRAIHSSSSSSLSPSTARAPTHVQRSLSYQTVGPPTEWNDLPPEMCVVGSGASSVRGTAGSTPRSLYACSSNGGSMVSVASAAATAGGGTRTDAGTTTGMGASLAPPSKKKSKRGRDYPAAAFG